MNLRFVLVFALAALALGWLGHGVSAVEQPKDNLMKQKLVHSQQLLEGIALADFAKIEKNADDLISLSHKAAWRVLQTPDYTRYSDEFRRGCDGIIKMAKQKNIDGASLAYVQVTLTCVNCHKHVREVRMASVPEETDRAMLRNLHRIGSSR
jgi:hypothetical protein